MANKALIALLLGGAAIGAIVLVRKAAAAPPVPPLPIIPTVEQIMLAQSLAELNAFYDQIGALYTAGKIDEATYTTLWSAYEARFYQLV